MNHNENQEVAMSHIESQEDRVTCNKLIQATKFTKSNNKVQRVIMNHNEAH